MNKFTKDALFKDNVKAYFGDSTDFQIYHDGSNSHIKNSGSLYVASETSGDLYLRSDDDIFIQPQGGEDGIKVIGNGAVELYHDNAKKFETDSSGVTVTGNVISNDGSNNARFQFDNNNIFCYAGGAK